MHSVAVDSEASCRLIVNIFLNELFLVWGVLGSYLILYF